MITLHVHFDRPLTDEESGHLLPGLLPSIALTEGGEPSDTTQILISGRPTREQLADASDLRTLTIPWAGLPGETRDLMGDFPGVSVHNLHHNAAPVAELALMLLLAAVKFAPRYDSALRANNMRAVARPELERLANETRVSSLLGYRP